MIPCNITFRPSSETRERRKWPCTRLCRLRSTPYVTKFCLWCWQEPDLVRLMSEEEGSNRLNDTPDLLILSNDIPASPAEELVITGEDEDDPGQYLLYSQQGHPQAVPVIPVWYGRLRPRRQERGAPGRELVHWWEVRIKKCTKHRKARAHECEEKLTYIRNL